MGGLVFEMANFKPLRNYTFYCLDQFIARYDLVPPFLDIGCGTGDLSAYIASRGWHGKAIDSSEIAIKQARLNLKLFPQVAVLKESLFEESDSFKTIFLWDVIEHIEDDDTALKKVASLLLPSGYLLIVVPSNPGEWRWDDDFYGHYRRYTAEEMGNKIIKAGLKPMVFWDFTYPVFWIMRRLYTRFKSFPKAKMGEMDMETKTSISSTANAWDIPIISYILNKGNFVWRLMYYLQFLFFKNKLKNGHAMFVLARKPNY